MVLAVAVAAHAMPVALRMVRAAAHIASIPRT